MPAQEETVGFCAQYYSLWTVKSDSGDAVYNVTLSGTWAHCTCPAYRFFKGDPTEVTCKHIKKVWDHGCLWNPQWHDGGPNDYAEHGIVYVASNQFSAIPGATCPRCGGPLVAVRIAV